MIWVNAGAITSLVATVSGIANRIANDRVKVPTPASVYIFSYHDLKSIYIHSAFICSISVSVRDRRSRSQLHDRRTWSRSRSPVRDRPRPRSRVRASNSISADLPIELPAAKMTDVGELRANKLISLKFRYLSTWSCASAVPRFRDSGSAHFVDSSSSVSARSYV